MEKDNLIKLAGEQALLIQERKQTYAAQQRDKQALLELYNRINSGTIQKNWLEGGLELLQRLQTAQEQLADADRRIKAYSELTGI